MNDEDLERQVATALHELYPEPGVDTLTIRQTRRQRPARIVAVVGAAAAVVAVGVIVGLLQAGSPDDSQRPGHTHTAAAATHSNVSSPPQSGAAAEIDPLIASPWKLVSIEPASGTVNTPSAAVELKVHRDGTMTMACNATTATLETSHISVSQSWTSSGLHCRDLNSQQSRIVYTRIFDGTVSWSISHQHLTIAKPGAGLLKFAEVAPNR